MEDGVLAAYLAREYHPILAASPRWGDEDRTLPSPTPVLQVFKRYGGQCDAHVVPTFKSRVGHIDAVVDP